MAVVSIQPGRRTPEPRISAWNCMRKSLALAPPSTFSSFRAIPESASMAAITSRRLISQGFHGGPDQVIPSHASGKAHDNAPGVRIPVGGARPVKAGTTYTPPVSSTARQQASD